MNNENEVRKDELTEAEETKETTAAQVQTEETENTNEIETTSKETSESAEPIVQQTRETTAEKESEPIHVRQQINYGADRQPQYNYNPYGYNPQQNSNGYNPQQQGYYHTAYNGNYYDPRYNPQAQYQPMNEHQYVNANANGKKAKKRSSGKGVIAAIVAGCVVLSAAVGIGGAFITNRVLNNKVPNIPVDNAQNGVITDRPDSETQNAAAQTTPGVIFKAIENEDNTGKYSSNPIVNAAAIAGSSVVEITTETVQTNSFYGQYVTKGAGSGVVITDDGYIITCAHVIDGASAVTVRFKDGAEAPAKIIGSDAQTDIAVIKVEKTDNLTPAIIGNSDNLLVGETAIAIGNPLGELGGSVSSGIISALDREIEIDGDRYNLLQTTAAINPGNSGGGLFNVNGELIGVVNAKQAGSSIEGLGFSIPINQAIDIAEQLINNGYIKGRVRLGIEILDINKNTNTYQIYSQYPQLMNYITAYGVYFIEYDAEQTGDMKFGDRIVAIDGVTIESYAELRSLLTEYEIGDTVTITVARMTTNGRVSQSKMVDVSLTLIESVPETTDSTAKTVN